MAAIAIICEVGIEGSKYFPPGSDLISLDIKDCLNIYIQLHWTCIETQ